MPDYVISRSGITKIERAHGIPKLLCPICKNPILPKQKVHRCVRSKLVYHYDCVDAIALDNPKRRMKNERTNT
jgi:hypothetical protein